MGELKKPKLEDRVCLKIGMQNTQKAEGKVSKDETIGFYLHSLDQPNDNIDDWNLEQAAGARLLEHNTVVIQTPEHTQQQRHIHEMIALSACQRSVRISHPVIVHAPSSTVFAEMDKGRAWSSKPHQAMFLCLTHSIDGRAKSSYRKNIMI